MASAVENTTLERIQEIRERQDRFFRSGATLEANFRKKQLEALGRGIRKWERVITDALWEDLHKSYEEAYLTEISIVLGEVRNHLKNVDKWMKPRLKPTPVKLMPSVSRIVSEPLGTALIVSPWNYPVQLLLNPLVGAISSGCTAVLKPSPYVPNVSLAIEKMISDTFPEEYVAVIQGNRVVNQALLEQRWDIIFFTGSPDLGRKVMEAASKHLTPVVLELGGKSPCIVDEGADIRKAAKRIAWGKALNAGQTCIAPDYLMLHESIKDQFLEELQKQFRSLLGKDPQKSRHFVRIVNQKAFDRLEGYLKDGKILFGGHTDREDRYFSPTVLDNVSPDAPVMQEEIFGPIFPVQTFRDVREAIDFVTSREKPLALYYFGKDGDKVTKYTSAGGTCINDTIMHIANENVPFGGVGNSGMGAYHGKLSFDAFTHYRSVISTTTKIDMPFRYMPYRMFSLVKKIL